MSKQQHKILRQKFNETCLKRDKNKCVICGEQLDLEVHHITNRHIMPNGGYTMYNGITLCPKHHWDAKAVLNGSLFDPTFNPDNLYELINSSYQKALIESEKL